jgi:serine/threonine protein kinase
MSTINYSFPDIGTAQSPIAVCQAAPGFVEDYAAALASYGLSYIETGYYYQVGQIEAVQGWILHISVIRSQILGLLGVLLPELIGAGISFKVIKDKDAAKTLLDGDFGQSQVGKVICIYPHSVREGINLAARLIALTQPFKGPAIPTDFHLGGTVYTRWGSFNPILLSDVAGKLKRHIYDSAGNLKQDLCSIPFVLPGDTEWPFSAIREYRVLVEKPIFQGKYKPISILSFNPKGSVFRSIYLRSFFSVKPCIIKEGKREMWSDDQGRNIGDRLRWQWEVYQDWSTSIRVPNMISLFTEDGDTYLVMEEIKGTNFYTHINQINFRCEAWMDIEHSKLLTILSSILNLIGIIDRIHQKGYIHRDITPLNFLVEKKTFIVPIDVELTFSLESLRPQPPFEFGTYGFMSPEQTRVELPTYKEDIYGLGATIVTSIVGLPPGVFQNMEKGSLNESLFFFTGDKSLAGVMTDCLQPDPSERPSLKTVQNTIQDYHADIEARVKSRSLSYPSDIDRGLVHSVIENAIRGLVAPPTLFHRGLWQSRIPSTDQIVESQRREFGKAGGLSEGITGVLYFLARAKIAGFSIDPCLPSYENGWVYIREKYCVDLAHTAPGFYGGAAGIALALVMGIKAGLLNDDQANRLLIRECLEMEAPGLDVAQGIAGQGIALLQCSEYLDELVLHKILNKYINILVSNQQKTGEWLMLQDSRGKKSPAASLSYGNTGILCFLLEYSHRFGYSRLKATVDRSLNQLLTQVKYFRNFVQKQGFRKVIENIATSDGIPGTIIALVKAYELLKDSAFKDSAENILAQYPRHMVHENIAQDIGLTGMGELYLEAYRAFGNQEWKDRANGIVHVLLHTRQENPGETVHWLNNNANYPTADLMVGNSGVIHFLIRSTIGGHPGYRLLN